MIIRQVLFVVFLLTSVSLFAGMKVGYADFTARGSCPKFEEMALNGYTNVIYAFCLVEGSSVTIPEAYLGQYRSLPEMVTDMKMTKEKYKGFQVFLSFGGAEYCNTWKPAQASSKGVGEALGKFAYENGFDGIDFDIEVNVDPVYIKEVVNQISAVYPELYISMAPQAVGALHSEIDGAWDNFSKAGLVTGGWCYGYNDAIETGNVDYIWPQMYNNVWCKLNGITQSSAEYIKQFKTIKYNVKIPANTLILPGIPATEKSGNGATGHDSDANIKAALDLFPGTMTWSINNDALNNWNMVKNVMP